MGIPETVARFRRSRTEREQRVIAAGLVLATLAGLYALVWEPGFAATRRLAAQLPRLRAEVAEMRHHQEQVAALRKAIGESRQDSTPQALLQALLASDPALKGAQAQWRSSERLALEIAAIDFDAWLALAARLQRDARVRVESCTVTALPQSGLVRVDAILAAPVQGR